tara:strand:- start:23178 stop:23324 length:147 start_codon:yes stop_codon:yes gene_type:complete
MMFMVVPLWNVFVGKACLQPANQSSENKPVDNFAKPAITQATQQRIQQ